MAMGDVFTFLLFLICWLHFGTEASHFRGAIFSWQPTEVANQVEIDWRISWRRSFRSSHYCDQNTIDNGILNGGEGTLQCLTGCSGTIAALQYYCTDFSENEDWTSGVNSVIYDSQNPSIVVSFTGNAWISLNVGGGRWSLVASIDLTTRLDTGQPNSSPRTAMTPIIRMQHSCNHTLKIPVNDPDGDIIRCRWAQPNNDGHNECGGVCNALPNSVLDGDSCELQYEAIYQEGWYAVALMIEDFHNASSITPISKIPLQFLVFVYPSSGQCSSAPQFIDPTPRDEACVGIAPNETYYQQLIALTGADEVSIQAIETISPVGLVKSAVGNLKERLYYINITWTPNLPEQYGENIFCFTAEDSVGLSSNQHCITLVAGVAPPRLIMESLQPPPGSVILSSNTVWTLQYDIQYVRPPTSRPTYITFYNYNNNQELTIDASSSPRVTYLPNGGILISTPSTLELQEKLEYFIVMESGIARGLEFCGPESSPIFDSNFWSFRIKDTTPPQIYFIDAPTYTNAETTIVWVYDEPANSTCTLQTPDQEISFVNCNLFWGGVNLTEGLHSLFITGVDPTGNVADAVIHSWTVDLTPPIATITGHPPRAYNERTAIFYFTCNEPLYVCTFDCALKEEGDSPTFVPCNDGMYSESGLAGVNYEFQVMATDYVGNKGNPINYTWYIDTTPPVIDQLPTKALLCGDDFSPNITGTPDVSDTQDPSPTLWYVDNPTDGCNLERLWTARDEAYNTQTMTQSITFSSPKPPEIYLPLNGILACGDPIEDERSAADLVNEGLLTHLCNRSMDASYRDSTNHKVCGMTFTRTWTIIDDCGGMAQMTQTITILENAVPEQPQNGQINVNLDIALEWPPYPNSFSYDIYVWMDGQPKPKYPTYTTPTRRFKSSSPYLPNTRYLWQVNYQLQPESENPLNATVIPSPVWIFITRTYADFTVTEVNVPSSIFSGKDITISWTVQNIGSRSSGVSYWYDTVNMSPNGDLNPAIYLLGQRESRYLDPNGDSYVTSATFRIAEDRIGTYYFFVITDSTNNVDDYDRSNNQGRTVGSVEIRLTPPPDLVVTDIVVPEISFSGRSLDVKYTVTNLGTGVTATGTWRDAIYWSSDNTTFSSSTTLAVTLHSDNGLQPNAAYTVTQTVTVPRYIYGNYWIYVKADHHNDVYEYLYEDNNAARTKEEITVTLDPPPDLDIDDFVVPSQAESTEEIVVAWTVKNIGFMTPYETFWRDLVNIQGIDGSISRTVTKQSFSGELAVSSSYSKTFNYKIPPDLPNGMYNLTLYVDYNSQVFEHIYESNNMKVLQMEIRQKLPDLMVISANASTVLEQENGKAYLKIQWVVGNTGSGRPDLSSSWIDRVLIADEQRNTDILGDLMHQSGDINEDVPGLPAGSSYVALGVFQVQLPYQGEVQVTVNTDYSNKVLEENDDISNNSYTFSVNIPHHSSDVRVDSIQILEDGEPLEYVFAGQIITVKWTTVNVGNWPTSVSSWLDEVYISEKAVLDESAATLGDFIHEGVLQVDGSYEASTDVVLPDGIWGEYSILIQIDTGNRLWQSTESELMVRSIFIYVETPPYPSLSVKYLSYTISWEETTAYAAEDETSRFISVSWSVNNLGNSMIRPLKWEDAVILSKEKLVITPPNANVLGIFKKEGQLMADQTYNVTKTIMLPYGLGDGNFFVYVVPDYYKEVPTSEEPPLYEDTPPLLIPVIPEPDLQAEYDSGVPTEIFAGSQIDIVFDGINIGPTGTKENSWVDAIYLDPVLATSYSEIGPSPAAMLIAESTHVGSLTSGERYTSRVYFQVPFSSIGMYDVWIQLNSMKDIEEDSYENNFVKSSSTMTVLKSPLPDITTSLTGTYRDPCILSGEPFDLLFNISNNGIGAILNTPFFCSLYLSSDVELDPFDLKFATFDMSVYLDPNNTEPINKTVFMPYELLPADYYLLLKMDTRNDIYELDEDNNVDYSVTCVGEPSSSDIVVLDVIPPGSSVSYPQDITIGWKLLNNGSESATGYICDTVYFSEDKQWEIKDTEIDTKCSRVSLDPWTQSDAYELVSPLPQIRATNYNTIVKSRSNIRDLNLNNNVGVSASTTEVKLDDLIIGVTKSVQMEMRVEKIFRVPDVTAEETLLFRLESDTATDFNEIYVQYRDVATTGNYDAAGREYLSANQDVSIANSRKGEYYVLIRKTGTSSIYEPPSYVSNISLSVDYAVLDILSVSPRIAAPLGTVTLRITGTLLPEEAIATLQSENNVIPADNIYHFNSLEMYATFNVTNLPISSSYSLQISDGYNDEECAVFSNALNIIEGRRGTTRFRYSYPAFMVRGQIAPVVLLVENIGDTDILTPMLSLELDGNGQFEILYGSRKVDWTSGHILYAVPDKGPGGILPPGGSSTIHFNVRPDSDTPMTISTRVTEFLVSDNIEHPYLNKTLMKPYKMHADTWEPIWENFLAVVGLSQASLSKHISQTANHLSLIGRRIIDMAEIIQYQTRLAEDFISGNKQYYDSDISFGPEDGGYHRAEVIRNYPGKISLRNFHGLFGRGWQSPYWDLKLAEITSDEVVLNRGSQVLVFTSVDDDSHTNFDLYGIGKVEIDDESIIFIDETVSVKSFYHFDKITFRLLLISNEFDNSTVKLRYDRSNRLDSLSFSEGFEMNIIYNIKDLIDTINVVSEDSESKSSRYTYDDTFEYLISAENEDETYYYSYTQAGLLASVQKTDGSKIEFAYNELNFLSRTTWFDDYSDVISTVVVDNDATGKIVLHSEPTNETNIYMYDEYAKVRYMKQLGLLSHRIFKNYETSSQMSTIGDLPLLKQHYDSSTEIMTLENPNGDQIVMGITPDGILSFIQDGEENTCYTEFDGNYLKNLTFPDGSIEKYEYDDNKQLKESTSRSGDVTNFERDADNNIVSKTFPSGESVHYLYDNRGLVIEATNNVVKMFFFYTDDGMPSMVQYSDGRELHYEYDKDSRRIGLYDNQGYNISYVYDKRGRLYKVIDNNQALGDLMAVEFDEQGRISRQVNANNCSTQITYNIRGKREEKRETVCDTNTGSKIISKTTFNFGTRNRIKSRNSSHSGIWRYRYDAASQLTSWVNPNGTEIHITYDKARNRRVITKNGEDTFYYVNNLNQYKSFGSDVDFSYDQNGHLIRIIDRGSATVEQFTYNYENKLVEIATPSKVCSFSYDALGNLYRKVCGGETVDYFNDPFGVSGADVIAEITNGTRMTYYVHAAAFGLVSMTTDDNTYYYHCDVIGSVVAMTDISGELVNWYEYDPFGNIFSKKEQVSNPYQYTGQWGSRRVSYFRSIYHMGARFYDSQHGRFLSVDPLGFAGMSENLYCYVNNNPIELIDPKGTNPMVIIGALYGTANSLIVYVSTTDDLSLSGALIAAGKGLIGGAVGAVVGPFAGAAIAGLLDGGEEFIKQAMSGKDFDKEMWNKVRDAATLGAIAGLIPSAHQFLGKSPGLKAFVEHGFKTPDAFYKHFAGNELKDFLKCLSDKACRSDEYDDLTEDAKNALDALLEFIGSIDPNDIIGPAGYGAARFISSSIELPYKIRFENEVNATAPAQLVYIETTLDSNTDLRSLRLGDFGFGNYTKEISPTAALQETLDMVESLGIYVRVFAGIDIMTRKVSWTLQAIDPETGQQPADPSVGFLPPNPVNGTEGQGFVTYSVRVAEGTSDLETIDAKASIIFDNNEPIDTPAIFNTVDSSFPTVNLSVPEETLATGVLTLDLNPFDAASGVRYIDIYVGTESGREVIAGGVIETIVTLDLPIGRTYNIVVIAMDNVGNIVPSQDIPLSAFYEIDFPEPTYDCDFVKNCSGNGTCVGSNVCECFADRYGPACDSETPPVEPPVIVGAPGIGTEDTLINLTISVTQTDEQTDSITEVIVQNTPAEAFFTIGRKVGSDWFIPIDRVPEMALIPAPHDSDNFMLTLIAMTTRSLYEASRQIILPVSVKAVADAASLEIELSPICFEELQKMISINITVEAVDEDGSEVMIITASGVPENMTLSPATAEGDGVFVILPEDVPYLLLMSDYNDLQPANISFTVETIEVENNDSAVVSNILEVMKCPRIPLPPTTIQPPTTLSPAVPSTMTSTAQPRSPSPSGPTHSPVPSQPTQSQRPSQPVETAGPTKPQPTTERKPTPSSRPSREPTPTNGISTTNASPLPGNVIFMYVAVGCFGGLLLIAVAILGIMALKKGRKSHKKEYDDDDEYLEEEINMHEFGNDGFDSFDNDEFDPFEGTHEATVRARSKHKDSINWVNSNYGFM